MSVPQSDIQELTQQIMVGLTVKLKQYDREKGKFRAWLHMVVRNEVLGNIRKQKSRSKTLERYTSDFIVHQDDKSSDLDTLILNEWDSYLFKKALERVRESTSASAIQIMELTMKGCSTDKIADTVGVATTTVYNLRRIVKQHMTLEIRKMIEELEG